MLYTPPSQFQFEYDDTTAGTANITTMLTGIAATAGAANTKGAWAEIVSAADRDLYGFWMMFTSAATTASGNRAALCDIGIGGAGSEQVLLSNFVMGFQYITTAVTFGFNPPVYVPLHVRKGERVAVRVQCATASRVSRLHFVAESGASVPRSIFSGVDTYGADTSVSTGTNIASNASANTFGSWTNVGSTTSRDYKGFLVSHQAQNVSTLNTRNYLIEFGYGGQAFCRVLASSSTVEIWYAIFNAQPVIQNIPAGTQLQARVSCDTASNTETPSVAFHCFY